MKKSVIIIIGVIYVMAIMLVSFLGLKIDLFNEVIYVESIEITNEENVHIRNGQKWIVFYFDEDDPNNNVVQLEWKVNPDNATKKNVRFAYDKDNGKATVNAFGTVVFNQPGTVSIQVLATDGSGKSVNVTVFARQKIN